MTAQICRPCRDLARRQLRALIEVHHPVPRASIAEIASASRRQYHQTAPRRNEQSQPEREPSTFAKAIASVGSAILPKKATQPYAIFGATDLIYKACSAPANYIISPELRKTDDVPKTEDGEEIGVGGGVWHDGSFFAPSGNSLIELGFANIDCPQNLAFSLPLATGRK